MPAWGSDRARLTDPTRQRDTQTIQAECYAAPLARATSWASLIHLWGIIHWPRLGLVTGQCLEGLPCGSLARRPGQSRLEKEREREREREAEREREREIARERERETQSRGLRRHLGALIISQGPFKAPRGL